MFEIVRVINTPINSNCFIIYNENNKNCIVIDPGSEDTKLIEEAIGNKTVDFIILTHEHFDHIWGVETIRNKYNTKLYCSEETNKAIVNKKKNMSLFYNQKGFELNPADKLLADNQHIEWEGKDILIIHTPGHTPGSICIKIDNNLFTGDTVIQDIPAVTKLPGGNKEHLKNSLEKLEQMGLTYFNLYYGHGKNNIKF